MALVPYSEKDGTTIKGYLFNSAKAISKEDEEEEIATNLLNGGDLAKLDDEERK